MRDQQPVEHERLDELYSSDRGFFGRIGWGSLIVVIFLVGLSIIGSTSKRNYIIKAQVSQGVVLAIRVRIAVEAYVDAHGELPASNEDAGLPLASEISDNYVSQIGIEDGEIVVVYGRNAESRIAGKTIVVVPDVSNPPIVSWTCSSPDIPDKWLTSDCRSP